MGRGIDLARELGNHEHADAIDNMKDQLLLVLIKRLGSDIRIPAAEIDATGGLILEMSMDQLTREFHFVVSGKH